MTQSVNIVSLTANKLLDISVIFFPKLSLNSVLLAADKSIDITSRSRPDEGSLNKCNKYVYIYSIIHI